MQMFQNKTRLTCNSLLFMTKWIIILYFQGFPCGQLYFTIFIHGEMSEDDRCSIRWCDERHPRGGCIATWHWHWVSRVNARRAGVGVVAFSLPFFGLHWWGRGRGGPMLLLQLLQLERSNVNHRVGVDFSLGGGSGDGLQRLRVTDGWILAFPAWWQKEDTLNFYRYRCNYI